MIMHSVVPAPTFPLRTIAAATNGTVITTQST
jgi:hypothetical protein